MAPDEKVVIPVSEPAAEIAPAPAPMVFAEEPATERAAPAPVAPASPSRPWAYAHMVRFLERQGLPFGDRGEQFLAAGLKEPLDRPARYAHPLSGLFLLQAFEIAQPHRLQLVQSEFDDFQLRQRDARRLEQVESIDSPAVPGLLLTRHSATSIGLPRGNQQERPLASGVHMHIMKASSRGR